MISASWYHVLLLLIGISRIKRKNNRDIGYENIQFNLKPAYVYGILLVPLILVPRLSNSQLEHLFISYTYVIFYKQLMNILLPKDGIKHDKLLPLSIVSSIILFNYNTVKRTTTNMLLMYAYILTCVVSMIGTRRITTAEGVNDFIMSHMTFFISKLNCS